jgi:hypothetical protein
VTESLLLPIRTDFWQDRPRTVNRADEVPLQVVPEAKILIVQTASTGIFSGVRLCHGAVRSDATIEMRINYEQVEK